MEPAFLVLSPSPLGCTPGSAHSTVSGRCWMRSGEGERRNLSYCAGTVSFARGRRVAFCVGPGVIRGTPPEGFGGGRRGHLPTPRVLLDRSRLLSGRCESNVFCSWSACASARAMHLQCELLTQGGCYTFQLLDSSPSECRQKEKRANETGNTHVGSLLTTETRTHQAH